MKTRYWPLFIGLICLMTACSSSESEPSAQRTDMGVVGVDSFIGTDAARNRSDTSVGNPTRDCGGCPGRQICDGESGLCEEPPGCQGHEDCLDTRLCIDAICQDSCALSGCPGQQVCSEAGLCTEPDRCESDDACVNDRLCVGGSCLDPCTEDAVCPGMQICELDTGRCRANDSCSNDLDCEANHACIDGTCLPDCNEGRPCDGRQTCMNGLCIEPDRCDDNADCLGGRLCVRDTCTDACQNDSDCPGQRRCNLDTGLCPEPNVCGDDTDCDPGRICLANGCTDACVQGECPGGQACINARCQEPDLCIGDLDCIGDRICERQRCSDPCQDDSDCLGSDVCDPGTGRCVEFQPECIIDDDCPADAACIIGTCREGRCMNHSNCDAGEDCIDGGCAPARRPDCRNDADCGNQQRCAVFGRCVDADQCRGEADCQGLNSICFDSQCVACRVDSDCHPSEVCDAGRCEFQGLCDQDADCPAPDGACENNRCIAAPCAGDEFDLRLGRPQLNARLYTNMVLCDGDADLYRFEIGPGEGALIDVRHQENAGDLRLNVRSLGEEAWGQSIAGVARAGLLPKPLPRMLEVSITGRAGYRTPYWLDLRRTTPGQCVPDDDEPALGNDRQDNAQPLANSPNVSVSRLCQDDRDWFRFIAPGGTSVTAVVTSDQLAGLDVNLVNSLGGPAGDVVNNGRDKRITVTPQRRGEFGLQLSLAPGVDAATNFIRLEIEANPDAAARACADAPRINIDDVFWFDNQLSVDRLSNQCGGPSLFNDRVARITIVQQGRYRVRTMQSDRSTTIALRSDCGNPQSEQACGPNGDLGPVQLNPGDYWILIDSPLSVPMGLFVERID